MSGIDLQEWVVRTTEKISESQRRYHSASTDEERRQTAANGYIGLLIQLDMIPELQGLGQLPVVRDLMDFLEDLERGRDHPWRSLGPFGGKQELTSKEQRLHFGALTAIEMLIDADGHRRGSKAKAYAFVSKELAGSGRSLSVSTLRGLHNRYLKGELSGMLAVKHFIQEHWKPADPASPNAMPCIHGSSPHACVASGGKKCTQAHATAQELVRGIFAEELFLQTP